VTGHNPYLGPAHPAHAHGAQGPSMRCPLVPRPRQGAIKGRVTSEAGEPVSSAMLELAGPTTLRLSSDPLGQFVQLQVPTGSYALRAEAEGYLLRMVNVDIIAGQTVDVPVVLVPKPKQAQVVLTAEEVRIRQQVYFKTNSAEISSKSNALLTEIADVLLRNPQVKLVEIQGHTDNTGNPVINRTLSQLRAEAVRTWLVTAGVAPGRLTAKGYGDERPLLPNLTERARARNRRVQMVIREQP
jgi:outer membrane protein OmpA-like peptidoglycan-associated protein